MAQLGTAQEVVLEHLRKYKELKASVCLSLYRGPGGGPITDTSSAEPQHVDSTVDSKVDLGFGDVSGTGSTSEHIGHSSLAKLLLPALPEASRVSQVSRRGFETQS